jgi:hypothetical protein
MICYCLYQMDPIGVGGEVEAVSVIRFCSPLCRDLFLRNEAAVAAWFGGPIDVLLENDQRPCYPEPATAPIVVASGVEDGPGDVQEVCCTCVRHLA